MQPKFKNCEDLTAYIIPYPYTMSIDRKWLNMKLFLHIPPIQLSAIVLHIYSLYSMLPIPPRGYILLHMKDDKNKLIRNLKIIEGQVRGLQDMIEKDVYCIDIITQASAVKQGISNIEDKLLEKHLSHCLINQIKEGKSDKAKEEIIKVYRLKRK